MILAPSQNIRRNLFLSLSHNIKCSFFIYRFIHAMMHRELNVFFGF
jgi:hypothetical protein